MQGFAAYATQGEDGYLSNWSIMHTLFGYSVHLLWKWAGVGAPTWLSLFMVAVLACVFELVENEPTFGQKLWTATIGLDAADYRIDALKNAVTDILVALLGWVVVELVTELSDALATKVVLLVVGLLSLSVFLAGFAVQQRSRRTPLAVASSSPVPTVVRDEFGPVNVGSRSALRLVSAPSRKPQQPPPRVHFRLPL